ncbi:MAG: hypothetical protein HY547_08835 [Elusimicrobia bacterium]|nr:hypothetical protein [Elusimicrobiota bacterium]
MSVLVYLNSPGDSRPHSSLFVLEYQDEAGDKTYSNDEREPPFRHIKPRGNFVEFQFGFRNFNGNLLTAAFKLDKATVDKSIAEFGYRDNELDAIDAWFEKAQNEAQEKAQSQGVTGVISASSDEELERKVTQAKKQNRKLETALSSRLKELERLYEQKRSDYFLTKKFKLLPENAVAVNMPELVKTNYRRLFPAAVEFNRLAIEHDLASEDIIGAATAMVQTAMDYKVPPPIVGQRHTGGVWAPLEALSKGWGDCDTKTAVLASILLNWDHFKAIGVGLPGHYLMGVQHIAGRGDAFVEYQGLTYVLIEPSGPAWAPPGFVSDQTIAKLELAQGVSLEPFAGD